LVEKIEIFDSLNIYERSKLYESMQLKTVGPEKYIIREGEHGTCFYIVAEGQLVAYKVKNGENKLAYAYKKGDYFGEVSLLRNLPRQASVKTVTDVRLYFINA
jgi:cAMP-dependent protein kinase regulator